MDLCNELCASGQLAGGTAAWPSCMVNTLVLDIYTQTVQPNIFHACHAYRHH